MTAKAVPHPTRLDRKQVLALLAKAEAHIKAERLDAAAEQYLKLLAEPVLDELPSARTEVQANYGALLLHRARMALEDEESAALLNEAIGLLDRACTAYRRGQGSGSSATAATNLALAYFQRYRVSGERADLMAAHLALDGAEAAASGDNDTLDWVRSIRDLLLEHTDRRRKPR
mgnify:CR=1 FL=1